MNTVNLQSLTQPQHGRVDVFWHEDKAAGIERTLFHRITLPLDSFQLLLDDTLETIETELVFDWYNLDLSERYALDQLNLAHENYPDAEGSLVIGGEDYWCDVKQLTIEQLEPDHFKVTGEIVVEFEESEFAANERFSFETTFSAERG